MKRIVLISCVSKKRDHRSKAKDLYISALFMKNLEYARQLKPNMIFILSALHGLLDLGTEIEPYDKTLNKMSSQERKSWSKVVLDQLTQVADLERDQFIFLAGLNYRKFLLPEITYFEIPMDGLRIGQQLQWLTKNLNDE
jgi:hypothetical protein